MEQYGIERLVKIFQSFKTPNSESPDLYYVRARRIIDAIKKYNPDETGFKAVLWKIICNLEINGKRNNDKTTITLLFDGKWNDADDFVNASHDDLNPIKKQFRQHVKDEKKIRQAKAIDLYNSIQTRTTDRMMKGLSCPKCFSDDTEYLLLQTSRGDEGSTARSLCNSCGHRWKFR
jgi:DNA-directed RNA polymerase subunit M/transcription elongation factor TFIIS